MVYGRGSILVSERSILVIGGGGDIFDNKLVYNKSGKNFVKVENDRGMTMIFLGSSSPHRRQHTHLLSF